MNNTNFITQMLLTLFLFVGVDAIWLNFIAKQFYKTHLGHLMTSSPNLWAAALFYIIYSFGIVFFTNQATQNAPSNENLYVISLITGAVLGLVAYATFELTSLALLKDWSVTAVVVDIIWGTFLTALVAFLTTFILTR